MADRPFNDFEKVQAVRAILAKRFPACFQPKAAANKFPLKIGIRDDIFARCPDLPNVLVKRAIGDYITGPKYTRAMIAGAWRVDLDGNPATQVTEADQANAEFREKNRLNKAREQDRHRKAVAKATAEVSRETGVRP